MTGVTLLAGVWHGWPAGDGHGPARVARLTFVSRAGNIANIATHA